jgi:uncharacterized membrane protein
LREKTYAKTPAKCYLDQRTKMEPATAIALWAVLFVVTHILIASARVRPTLVRLMGEQGYRGVYSLAAFVTFIPLVITFAYHKHAGLMLWNLRGVVPVRWLAWLMMLAALIFVVAGFVTPNPGAIGARPAGGAVGILKLTRHPSLVGLTLFGLAHMLMNGWAGDLWFFGSFPALGVLGGFHQDGRKIGEMGESYRKLIATTSFFPGAALWSGRQQWSSADMPWAALGIGSAATILVIIVHPILFGGSPLG